MCFRVAPLPTESRDVTRTALDSPSDRLIDADLTRFSLIERITDRAIHHDRNRLESPPTEC